MDNIQIDTDYIKLDQLLKWVGIVGSGTEAKYIIQDGLVTVNKEVVTQRGKKIFKGDYISISLDEYIEFIVE